MNTFLCVHGCTKPLKRPLFLPIGYIPPHSLAVVRPQNAALRQLACGSSGVRARLSVIRPSLEGQRSDAHSSGSTPRGFRQPGSDCLFRLLKQMNTPRSDRSADAQVELESFFALRFFLSGRGSTERFRFYCVFEGGGSPTRACLAHRALLFARLL